MSHTKGIAITVSDVRNPEILNWLLENQSEYEVNIGVTNQPVMISQEMNGSSSNQSSICSSSSNVLANRFDAFNEEELNIDLYRESLLKIPGDIGGILTKDGILKGKGYEHTIGGMIDSTELYNDQQFLKLYQRFAAHGYILLRNVLDPAKIQTAQNKIKIALNCLHWIKKDGKSAMSQGLMVDRAHGDIISGVNKSSEEASGKLKIWKEVGTGEELRQAVCQAAVSGLIEGLAQGKAAAEQMACEGRVFEPSYSWLRIKKPGESTPVHADLVYFKQFTEMFNGPKALGDTCLLPKVDRSRCCHSLCEERRKDIQLIRCDECFWTYHLSCMNLTEENAPKDQWFCANCQPRLVGGTCWVPLQDMDSASGTMAFLPGTMNLPFPDRYYGDHQLAHAYYTHTRGLSWHVAPSLKVGDILLFDWRLVHAATKNTTVKPRMSLDFRFVLKPLRPNHRGTSMNGYVEMNTISASDLLTAVHNVPAADDQFESADKDNYEDIEEESLKDIVVKKSKSQMLGKRKMEAVLSVESPAPVANSSDVPKRMKGRPLLSTDEDVVARSPAPIVVESERINKVRDKKTKRVSFTNDDNAVNLSSQRASSSRRHNGTTMEVNEPLSLDAQKETSDAMDDLLKVDLLLGNGSSNVVVGRKQKYTAANEISLEIMKKDS